MVYNCLWFRNERLGSRHIFAAPFDSLNEQAGAHHGDNLDEKAEQIDQPDAQAIAQDVILQCLGAALHAHSKQQLHGVVSARGKASRRIVLYRVICSTLLFYAVVILNMLNANTIRFLIFKP